MAMHAPIEVAGDRPGINVAMGGGDAPVVSDVWTMGRWTIQFVRLGPGQQHDLPTSEGATLVKVITGRLSDPDRGAYAESHTIRNLSVDGSSITAGPDGALCCVITDTGAESDRLVTDISELELGGPHAEVLRWQTFESKFTGVTTFFDGLDAHLAPGFHLLDEDGAEIAYVWPWVAGKGVDLSTHDHGRAPGPRSPAFAEVHLVLSNGTGAGGMYETPEPGAPTRDRYPLQPGEEHGPFFHFDPDTGAPHMRENGAVDYPWHGWEAGADDRPGQAYDVVVPFEITVPYALVQP
jgi:hypothetical protein